MKTILGKKIGMTQIFTENGEQVPVTVVEAGPVTIIQVKTKEADGYDAIQIAFQDQKGHRLTKPLKGHFDKAGIGYKKYIAEIRLEVEEALEVGQVISAIDFDEGKKLDITGTSKGKGTQGNIKRHGHHRGPMTHGSKHKRMVGALAAGTYPSRVFKGNAGPGRMGRETITVQNLELVKIIPERNVMLIKGAVPGAKGSILRIQYAVKDPDGVRELGPTGRVVETVPAEAAEPVENVKVDATEATVENEAPEATVENEAPEAAAETAPETTEESEAAEEPAEAASDDKAPEAEAAAAEEPAAEAETAEEAPAAEQETTSEDNKADEAADEDKEDKKEEAAAEDKEEEPAAEETPAEEEGK